MKASKKWQIPAQRGINQRKNLHKCCFKVMNTFLSSMSKQKTDAYILSEMNEKGTRYSTRGRRAIWKNNKIKTYLRRNSKKKKK